MSGHAPLRVMIVDVEATVANVVVGEAGNGKQAIDALAAQAVDVMLVDIRMPGMDGIELAQHVARLASPPGLIFVTAYDSYAVQAFELNAIDYLVKPVRAQRLAAALLKFRAGRPEASAETLATLRQEARRHLSCHERGRLLLIPLPDILYLKADLKYVTARTAEREYLLDESLTHLEVEFAERFIRLRRSTLVARDAVIGFEKSADDDAETQWQALLRDVPEKLPVSRRHLRVKSGFMPQRFSESF